MTVHIAIGNIINRLEGIGKNQRNKEQGYNFRGIDDVLKALHPLLAQEGVFFTPDVIERQYEERTSAKGTVGHCCHLHVKYTVYGPEGDSIQFSTWGEGLDYGDKATNKAMTVAFKYALFQIFAISDPADDGDQTTPESGATTRREPPKRSVDNDTGEITGDIATMPLVDLTRALEAAKLSVAGNTAAKRARLAEYQAGQPTTNGHSPEVNEAAMDQTDAFADAGLIPEEAF